MPIVFAILFGVVVKAERAQVVGFITLDWDGFVAPLKEMHSLAMPRINTGRVGTLQPFHTIHEVPLRGLERQMVVVAHENVAVEEKSRSLAGFLQGSQKHSSYLGRPSRWLPSDPLGS